VPSSQVAKIKIGYELLPGCKHDLQQSFGQSGAALKGLDLFSKNLFRRVARKWKRQEALVIQSQ
jgi:hypothetical protein